MDSLYLIDGNSLLYRAFYAVPPFATAAGLPTNAVFGFGKMLVRLIKDRRPDRMAVVFDARGPTFRDQEFEHYKAHRPKAPDELNLQRPYVRRLVSAMNLALLEVEGVEADDVIGTLVKRHKGPGRQISIVTGDKDLMQFVDDGLVVLYDTMKNVVYDEKAVEQKMGVGPRRIVDLLALMGDSSDNIPGVKGIGPKTAVKLLGEYGSFQAIMEAAEGIPGAAGEKIRADRDMAELSFRLSSIRTDVDVPVTLDDLSIRPIDDEAVRALCDELESASLLRDIRSLSAAAPPAGVLGSAAEEECPVPDMAAVERLWAAALQAGTFAYVLRTGADHHPMRVRATHLTVSLGDGTGYVIDLESAAIDRVTVLSRLKELLFAPGVTAVGYDVKADLHAIENELGSQSAGIPLVQPNLL